MTAEQLKYTEIKANGGTQMRLNLNQDTVADYADTMRSNDSYQPFPPLVVYYDGSDYWLADGFHRHAAAFQAFGSRCTIPADVRAGTRRDAILHAAGANAAHGLRRTNADKRRAVETMLRDDEWVKWSDNQIAKACNVSHPFVGKVRSETGLTCNVSSEERTYTTKHGTTATMNTKRIGTTPQPEPSVREISNLSSWLIARGWGIAYAVMPGTCYVRKGNTSFTFANREDKAGELAALRQAKAHEQSIVTEPADDDMRTYESTVAAIEPPTLPPANPDQPRPLNDAEAEVVVWRVIGKQVPQSEGESPQALASRRLAWLRKAEFSHFKAALAPGVTFPYEKFAMLAYHIDNQLTAQSLDRPAPSTPPPTTTRPTFTVTAPQVEEEEPTDAPANEAIADSDEYYTPRYIIEAARQVLGEIDLDPASCPTAQRVVQADAYFTKDDGGLTSPWYGRVWLNPPFSNPAPFTQKLIAEYEAGNTSAAILLVNNGTETKWGQALLQRFPVCFVGAHEGKGSRISFWKNDPDEPRTGNRYAQMIFFLGEYSQTFAEVFSQFGVIKT